MRYFEVFIASGSYRGNSPLTYAFEEKLKPMTVVSVPLRQRLVTGFVTSEVDKPDFGTKEIKTVVGTQPMPSHCLKLAKWMADYYFSSFGDALRQFAPSRAAAHQHQINDFSIDQLPEQLQLDSPLTKSQKEALSSIKQNPSTTVLLHGQTATGKTRVYLELAKEALQNGKSVLLLTPEIALTTQLTAAAKQYLNSPVLVLHSQLSPAKRRQIWLNALQAVQPIVVVGPRSAVFTPIHSLGLIVLDEAHEPAYKQEQSPRYHAVRVASHLGQLTGSRVILGTATPDVTDYYLAQKKKAIVIMKDKAIKGAPDHPDTEVIDLKNKNNFSADPYLSNTLIDAIKASLQAKKQSLIYLNRRGSARLVLCNSCGWQLLCPNCDIPLVYHGDIHNVRCHICGFSQDPPLACPQCKNPDIIYKSIGTKALVEVTKKLFPQARVQRFDTDNVSGERLNEVYDKLYKGQIDILVGTQLLAKGLDLPRLGLVGVIAAETSLALPDFSSEERSFQLLYQVVGRVGRGHAKGKVIIQSYDPANPVIKAALGRDWQQFYEYLLAERKAFRFPPFSYLMRLTCKRATVRGAESAAVKLAEVLTALALPVEIIGPTPSFYARRGKYYYWQIVVKTKKRDYLLQLAENVPQDWRVDMDPINLL